MCVTPGEHGNAELVNKYGFALPDNPFDTVKLDKQKLSALAKQKLGSKAYKKRRQFLDAHRSAALGYTHHPAMPNRIRVSIASSPDPCIHYAVS